MRCLDLDMVGPLPTRTNAADGWHPPKALLRRPGDATLNSTMLFSPLGRIASVAIPLPYFPFALPRPVELRVDVDPATSEPGESLGALYKACSPGDRLHGLGDMLT
jgi:hypothetical protein